MAVNKCAVTEIDALSVYERFLLDTLLKLAAEEAEKTLSEAVTRALIAASLENRRSRSSRKIMDTKDHNSS